MPHEASRLQQFLLNQLARVNQILLASQRHFIDPGIRLHLCHFLGKFLADACWCLLYYQCGWLGTAGEGLPSSRPSRWLYTALWQGEGCVLQPGKMLTWLIPILCGFASSLPNGCSSEELQCVQRKWLSSHLWGAGDLKDVFQGSQAFNEQYSKTGSGLTYASS